MADSACLPWLDTYDGLDLLLVRKLFRIYNHNSCLSFIAGGNWRFLFSLYYVFKIIAYFDVAVFSGFTNRTQLGLFAHLVNGVGLNCLLLDKRLRWQLGLAGVEFGVVEVKEHVFWFCDILDGELIAIDLLVVPGEYGSNFYIEIGLLHQGRLRTGGVSSSCFRDSTATHRLAGRSTTAVLLLESGDCGTHLGLGGLGEQNLPRLQLSLLWSPAACHMALEILKRDPFDP